ncbi:claudin-4-like [Heptranchias perlo]|uniref:claudin-4-like n=1 Tax=Heptranchias perlo TaxID=212740 RepID=UPI00355ABFD2
MAPSRLQVLGLALSVAGWLGAIVCCALPMWKVAAPVGTNIEVAQNIWEGLWMNCVNQSTGQMQCNPYDSLLDLPRDFQAARVLVIISLVVALVGICAGIIGASCIKSVTTRGNLAVVSGITFVVSSILLLLTAGWSAHSIIQDVYDHLVARDQKRLLGPSIYLAFVAGGLLLLGGVLLCCSWTKASDRYPAALLTATSTARQSKGSKA